MQRVNGLGRGAVTALAVLVLAGTVRAQPLDPRELALGCESTLVDLDLAALGLHFGPEQNRSVNYVSLVGQNGWQGRMWGQYAGHDVDVYYEGTIAPTGAPGNQRRVTYSSDWWLDGTSFGGSGEAYYSDAPVTRPDFNFEIDWRHMTVSGSVSISYGLTEWTIEGQKDFPNHKMSLTGTLGVLSVPLLGAAGEASVSFELDQLTGAYTSTLSVEVLWGLISREREINSGSVRRQPPEDPDPPLPPPRRPVVPPPFPYPPGGSDGPLPPSGGSAYNNMVATETIPSPGGIALALIGLTIVSRRRR